MSSPREFDLILQGATGFTGHLAAEEIALRAPQGFRWAVAGRDVIRTSALAQRFGVDPVIADGLDARANDALAARTQVVISCAGPFARYGKHLADACVTHGTHYADISGEGSWIRGLIEEHHAVCQERSITMIPAAGFDSVPSDLAVMAMREQLGPEVAIQGFFTIRGGFNGGTLFSGIAMAEDQGADSVPQASKTSSIFPVPCLKRWATPFLMAPVNEATVARSLELSEEIATSPDLYPAYREFMCVRGKMRAQGVRLGLKMIEGMFRSRFGRSMLQRFGPKPGEGPSEEDIRNGFARLTLVAGSLEVPLAKRTWSWTGDPSNRITVNSLVQTGLALAHGEAIAAGVLTPASGLGQGLLDRLLETGAVREEPAADS
ncbi:MAG: saccharopine dehydrogenase family protein [Planctomycetota bacterium]